MKKIVIAISIILFVVPFFWFKPGQMDLGGDASRLYFYDPFAYLKNYALYSVSPSGLGVENTGFFAIPFVLALDILKFFISSATLRIAAFHGMSLTFAFLFPYLTVKKLLSTSVKNNKHIIDTAGIFAGLFYLFSPSGVQGWDKVIFTHNQVFLNPLLFFLLLLYVSTTNFLYLLITLFITFIFAPNFSLASSPQIFSFYPLSILFLLLYRIFILKKPIIWKHLIIAFILFLGLHAFHLIPVIKNTFSAGSAFNTAVFSNEGKINRGLSYFSAIAPNIKVTDNLLSLPQMINFAVLPWLYFIFPILVLFGFLKNNTKVFLLIGVFFLISLFWATANITNLGYSFYARLFDVPGFSMFRNYYGQWEFLFLFFYTLVLGFSFYYVFISLKKRFRYILFCILSLLFIYTAIPLINGLLVNKVLWQSKNVHIFATIDPLYEKFLTIVRKLPIDGKIISFPLTDPGYQILGGKNGGAYEGPSTIAYLSGRRDFAGYDEFAVFGDTLMNAFKTNDKQAISNIFSLLNIKYLFHNEDPYIYDTTFSGFPYNNVENYLPPTQAEYKKLISQMPFKKIDTVGKYSLYAGNSIDYLPHIYVPKQEIAVGIAPEDWNLALHFYQVPSQRIAFLSPSSTTKSIDIFKADIVDVYRSIEKDFPVPVAYPYIKWSLKSPLYPIIVWRERHRLNKFKANDDSYTDQLLVTGAKRIAEIRKSQSILTLRRNINSIDQLLTVWQEPTGINLIKTRNYNQWEIALSRYTQSIQQAITTVHNSQLGDAWKTEKSIHIREVVKYNYSFLNDTILDNHTLSKDDKRYLFTITDSMYDFFDKQLAVPEYNTNFVNYVINPLATGSFNALVQKTPQQTGEILYNNNISSKTNTTYDNLFSEYQPVNIINSASKILSLAITPTTISDTSAWKPIDKLSVFAADEAFIPSLIPWDREILQGYYKEIIGLKENTNYLISFRYNTYGATIKTSFLRERNNENKTKIYYTPAFSEVKNTRKEMVFNAIVNSENANKILFVLKGLDNIFDIKNIAVSDFNTVELPAAQPNILFKSTQQRIITQDNIPQITFTKVNPVKYQVKIRNATKPYTLVLSDAFNANWKIYPSDFSYNEKVIAKYFNGDIQETMHKDIFLDTHTFDTVSQHNIAGDKHFLINGYANGWRITPNDVGGKKDYTLMLEMTTEKSFFAGSIISLLSFVVCICMLSIMLTKKFGRNAVARYKDAFFYATLERSLRGCKSVLDVGCGGDSPVGKIKKLQYSEGVDIYKPSIERSKKNNIHDAYKVGDILSIDKFYKPKSFDAVIALDVIEHLEEKDAISLIKKMEKIARKKVILLTPNGFYHQDHLDGNPHQEHKSGWGTTDLTKLGYKVFGLRGLKYIRGEYASIKYKPWIFWGIIAFLSEYLFYFIPQLSYHLFAVKKFSNEK